MTANAIRVSRLFLGLTIGAAILGSTGCSLFQNDSKGFYNPADFQPSALSAAPEGDVAAPLPDMLGDDRYTMNAMIGQVDGKPLYASSVLDPIGPQLEQWSKENPPRQFLQQAVPLVAQRMDQVVITQLILSDAERDLEEREKAAIRGMVAERRSELIRTKGEGSALIAEQTLREETGGLYGLDDMLEQYRQTVVIGRYRQKHILPKVIVTRRMIERYYETHPEEFRTQTTRKLRWIRTASPEAAAKVQAMLDANTPFEEVARSEWNRNNPEQGGLFGADGLAQGDEVFPERFAAMNEALKQLGAGQTSPPIRFDTTTVWVHVESVEPAAERSLTEAQDDIRTKLVELKFVDATTAYREDLLASGRFDTRESMLQSLMEVVAGRYAKGE